MCDRLTQFVACVLGYAANTDFSAYDSTQNWMHMVMESMLLKRCLKPSQWCMLDTWNALTYGDLNAKYCGIKFAGKASRDSGKITISMGNTILTWSVIQMCFIEYLIDKHAFTFEQCLDIIRNYGGV